MEKNDTILIFGGSGMVGSALSKKLKSDGYTNVICPSHVEVDLLDGVSAPWAITRYRPSYVFMLSARVGGIAANIANPVGFLRDNALMALNVLEACRHLPVKRLLYVGSSCIYPRECPQPMKEEYLLTGKLEPTNEGYALAKILGIKLAEGYNKQYGTDYICTMPCNIYGTGDNYNAYDSHVMSSLIQKFVDQDQVTVWGTGTAKREFIHVDDVAEALVLLMNTPKPPFITNVGTGQDISIYDLAKKISLFSGFKGRIEWDHTKADGMPRKCLDVSKLNALGFIPKVSLDEGIERTIQEYKTTVTSNRIRRI
jgi:GDP-L-fucose synthase